MEEAVKRLTATGARVCLVTRRSVKTRCRRIAPIDTEDVRVRERRIAMPTMRQVADHAGVSIATVSFVVNNTKPVTAATRARIEASMAELGYRPNAVARALASRRTRILALAYPARDHRLGGSGMEFMNAAAQAAGEHGYHLMIWPGSNDGPELTELVGQQLVDGVILMEVQLDDPRVAGPAGQRDALRADRSHRRPERQSARRHRLRADHAGGDRAPIRASGTDGSCSRPAARPEELLQLRPVRPVRARLPGRGGAARPRAGGGRVRPGRGRRPCVGRTTARRAPRHHRGAAAERVRRHRPADRG